jgi:hypothetical protein
MKGIDFAYGELTGAQLKAYGVDFCMHYSSQTLAKVASEAVVNDQRASGISVGFVYEDGAQWLLGDITDAANTCKEQLNFVPSDVPIYLAVDFAATSVQRGIIAANAYKFSEITGRAVRPYGDATVLSWFNGPGWQTPAWSEGAIAPSAVMLQSSIQSKIDGVSVDVDSATSLTAAGLWLADTTNKETNVTDTLNPDTSDAALEDATGQSINAPIVAGFATGNGYVLVGADGGVFCYGDANNHGSIDSLIQAGTIKSLSRPIVAAFGDSNGYTLIGEDGAVFTFGAAQFHGAL